MIFGASMKSSKAFSDNRNTKGKHGYKYTCNMEGQQFQSSSYSHSWCDCNHKFAYDLTRI